MKRPIALLVTEGALEIPAALRILRMLGCDAAGIQGIDKGGRNRFWREARRYNQAAVHVGIVLGFADLESFPCPSGLLAKYLPHGQSQDFVLRIAEPMLESWFLADAEGMARYLQVERRLFPVNPDRDVHPKRTLVNIARHSRRRALRADLVPDLGSFGVVGKGYTPAMTHFIETVWHPKRAAQRSESLRKAIAAIRATASRGE